MSTKTGNKVATPQKKDGGVAKTDSKPKKNQRKETRAGLVVGLE
jgi:hypothetical protein